MSACDRPSFPQAPVAWMSVSSVQRRGPSQARLTVNLPYRLVKKSGAGPSCTRGAEMVAEADLFQGNLISAC
jgi:hypothetical protein